MEPDLKNYIQIFRGVFRGLGVVKDISGQCLLFQEFEKRGKKGKRRENGIKEGKMANSSI